VIKKAGTMPDRLWKSILAKIIANSLMFIGGLTIFPTRQDFSAGSGRQAGARVLIDPVNQPIDPDQ